MQHVLYVHTDILHPLITSAVHPCCGTRGEFFVEFANLHLQIEHITRSQCPLNVKCFDHTLHVAAVTENNQQRWARDSYLPIPDSLLISLSLSFLSLSLSLQLLSFLEKKGVDSEGILRVPGSQSRIKVQNLDLDPFLSHATLTLQHIILSLNLPLFSCLMFEAKLRIKCFIN